jgi:cell wall-associated NlpC family hydrolase
VPRAALIAGLCVLIGGCATPHRAASPVPAAVPPPTSAAPQTPGAPGATTVPGLPGEPPAPGTLPTPADEITQFIETATAMLGHPYRFGGATPAGFDCSGLVSYAAASAGIKVPRTTEEQQRIGVAVRRRDILAGDLVFMRLKRREFHVGIAIDAEHFIHAPSTGGFVRIDSLDVPPYAGAYLRARRITAGTVAAAQPWSR